MKTRIMIADDHAIVREGLRSLLAKRPDLEIIGETGEGGSTVDMALKLAPDIIIMDITMPGLNGIEAARRLTQQGRKPKIIVLSMHSERVYIVEALKSGAMGFVLKNDAFEELLRAVDAVSHGNFYVSSKITEIMVKDYIKKIPLMDIRSTFDMLSPKEREILQLIAEGKSTKQIAAQLKVSIKTIESHRRQIMEKLNLFSIAELTKFAVREGLTPL